MNRKQFGQYEAIIVTAMVAVIGGSVAIGNAVFPLVAVIVGMTALYLAGRRVKEVKEDERTYRISEKASRMALQIVILATTFTGVLLIVLSNSGYAAVGQIGTSLAFSASAIYMLYWVLCIYYGKKFGD